MPSTERTHTRPAVAITTPALTRHMIFYFPFRRGDGPEDEPPCAPEDPLDREVAKQYISNYVCGLRETARSKGIPFHAPSDAAIFECLRRHASFGINLGDSGFGLQIRILIVLYQEHFTCTYILDNSKISNHFPSKCINDIETFSNKIMLILSNYASNNPTYTLTERRKIDLMANRRRADIDKFYQADIIYREIWVAIDHYLDHNKYVDNKWLDCIREDIRGLVVTGNPSYVTDEQGVFSNIQRLEHRSSRRTIFFDKSHKPCIQTFFDKESAFFAASLSLDSSIHEMHGPQNYLRWDPNVVLCYICGRSAIYGSSLHFWRSRYVPHSDRSTRQKNEFNHRRYFIIFDGLNDYSIGRIVRRLHILAELRCLAFVERHNIDSTIDALRYVGDSLSKIINDITNLSTPRINVRQIDPIINLYSDIGRSIFRTDGKIIIRTGKIVNAGIFGPLAGSGGTPYKFNFVRCNGGLTYRINRSKHYYDQLLQRLADLRVDRIKGFQPYDRFIARNYHQMMQSMLSVGERHLSISQKIDRTVSISHTFMQRLVAQTAIYISLLLAFFSGMSATVGVVNIWHDDNKKAGALTVYIAILAIVIFIFIILTNAYFKSRKIEVKDE